jgi:hypothetical protein
MLVRGETKDFQDFLYSILLQAFKLSRNILR